jgi:hypothetical protein
MLMRLPYFWSMKLLSFVGILALLFALACNKTSDSDLPVTKSGLMVYNMVPGESKFDALIDTTLLGENLPFGGQTGGFREFRAKKYTLNIFLAGNRDRPLFRGEINLRNNRYYSAFLTVDTQNVVRVVGAEDDLQAPPADVAKVRFINLSDSYVTRGRVTEPLPFDFYLELNRISRRLPYTGVTPFVSIMNGKYQVDVRYPDSTLSLQKFQLQADSGKIYTIVTTGTRKDNNLKVTQFINN